MNSPGPPANWAIQGDAIVVTDSEGREVWRKVLAGGIFVQPGASPAAFQPHLFKDVDSDGKTELLLAHRPTRLGDFGSELICFSSSGERKWNFTADQVVATRTETFSRTYTINQISLISTGRALHHKIVASCQNDPDYPNLVVVLSHAGKVLREYWHSGHLFNMLTADLNGDGRQEIYLVGVNQGRKQATLVVLDPETMGGASAEPENPHYQLLGLSHGSELARVFFPRTCISRLHEYPYAFALSVRGKVISVQVNENPVEGGAVTTVFELSPEFELVRAFAADGFKNLHNRLHAQGILNHPWSQAEDRALRQIEVLR